MTGYELGSVVQIAYAVDDVTTAATEFATRTGAGPFLIRRNRVTAAVGPQGETGVFDHSSAYGQWGRVQIELVQTHNAEPTAFAETTLARNRIHHVAIMVPDFDEHQRQLTATGWPALLTARTTNGNNFAFHDARPLLGHLIEIYEARPTILELYRRVAGAAQGWDGSNPARPM